MGRLVVETETKADFASFVLRSIFSINGSCVACVLVHAVPLDQTSLDHYFDSVDSRRVLILRCQGIGRKHRLTLC